MVTIRVASGSGNINPYLELFSPDGVRLQANGTTRTAQIDITLSASGLYTIVVSSSSLLTGNYDLSWRPLNRLCTLSISFSASPSSLSFSAPAGSAVTAPQQLELRSEFPGLPWRAQVSIFSGGFWLRLSSDFGQMPAAIQVTADATNLSAGTYQAEIEILAADASPPSQVIPVTFTVGGGRPPGLTVDPGRLSFQSVLGEPIRRRRLAS